MRIITTILSLIIIPSILLGQYNVIVQYDFINKTYSDLNQVQFDTTVLEAKTPYHIGEINSEPELLELNPPIDNTVENTQFTYKKKASDIFEINKYPISTSIKIFYFESGVLMGSCSGSLISKKHVFTAAHCFLKLGENIFYVDSILVCPAYDDGIPNPLFGCSLVSKGFSFKDWTLNGNDFLILELEEELGLKTGWIGIGFSKEDEIIEGEIFHKFSYPNITLFSNDPNEYNGDTLYYSYGVVDLVQSNFIGINGIVGIPGESGSSLIKYSAQGDYHSYGVGTWATNFRHSRISNWEFFSIKQIIENDYNVSVSSPKPFKVLIYPNPALDEIIIEFNHLEQVQLIQIYDNIGRIVKQFKIDAGIVRFNANIEDLSVGMYYLFMQTNERTFIKKILKHGS